MASASVQRVDTVSPSAAGSHVGAAAVPAGKKGRKPRAEKGARLPLMFWGVGLLCGAVMMFSPGTLLLMAALFSPLLVIAMVDSSASRGPTRTAALFAVAATIHVFRSFWTEDASAAQALLLLHEPRTLLYGWLTIGASWFVLEALAIGLRAGLEISMRVVQTRSEGEIAVLTAEWGDGETT